MDAAPGARPLMTALGERGFEVYAANRGRFAIPVGRSVRPDLIVLDMALPDGDGVETYDGLRAVGVHAPVLFLTAREDSAAGEQLGRVMTDADDHLTKPLELDEVIARVQDLLARDRADESRLLRHGDLAVDAARREVWRAGTRIELSTREFALLGYLLDNAGQVVTKKQILERVWGAPFRTGTVETYVYYLRRKLGDHDQSLIRTVRGLGYTMARG
ncbi:response regulator transcription factor [Streptomyces sp. NBC_01604]|uniref:response regulator transcription factor n=1 Tax=Streptomyces sp. NBC_01604 TaxID=2975894 RepID=UPI00386C9246